MGYGFPCTYSDELSNAFVGGIDSNGIVGEELGISAPSSGEDYESWEKGARRFSVANHGWIPYQRRKVTGCAATGARYALPWTEESNPQEPLTDDFREVDDTLPQSEENRVERTLFGVFEAPFHIQDDLLRILSCFLVVGVVFLESHSLLE